MKTLRIAFLALATILSAGFASSSHAFMPATESAELPADLANLIDGLRKEIALGATPCESMLEKLNVALNEIDAKLDIGVPNEAEYLSARDAITKMRYELDCVASKLAQTGSPAPMFGGGGGGSFGSFSSGPVRSGGGGSRSGGRGFGFLAPAAIGAAIIIPAVSDSDSPGQVASPSTTD